MLDNEWTDLWENTLCELWPKQGLAFTAEEQASYRRVMNPFPWEWCQTALRGVKDTANFCPKPAEMSRTMKTKRQAMDSSSLMVQEATRIERAAMHEDYKLHWEMVDEGLSDYSDKQIEAMKQKLLVLEPLFKWMKDKPITSRWWRAVIYKKIMQVGIRTQKQEQTTDGNDSRQPV